MRHQIQGRHIRLFWLVEWLILTVEMVGFGEVIEILFTLIKRKTRPLTNREMNLGIEFFGPSPVFRLVRIDSSARIGTRTLATAYVAGYTINSAQEISDATLIHELVHVMQYHRIGLRYISRALYGQHWGAGYDYGGIQGYKHWEDATTSLHDFNPEQEAELLTDLFLLSKGQPLGLYADDMRGIDLFAFRQKGLNNPFS